MFKLVARHLHGHAVAYLALFVALGGTSYAASRLPSNSVGTAQLRPGAVLAQDIGRQPAVKALTPEPTQPIGDGTFTAVRLEQEEFDIGAMHDPDQPTRIVARRSGTYVVQATAIFSGGTCGGPPRVVLIQRRLRNGGLATVDHTNSGTMCNEPTRTHAGAVVRMRANEYLELMVLQLSSPQVNVGGSMSAAYVGG
jgi:hypothetical protein